MTEPEALRPAVSPSRVRRPRTPSDSRRRRRGLGDDPYVRLPVGARTSQGEQLLTCGRDYWHRQVDPLSWQCSPQPEPHVAPVLHVHVEVQQEVPSHCSPGSTWWFPHRPNRWANTP